jgi:hypothetical protein
MRQHTAVIAAFLLGVAVVALLAVIAFALLSDDQGTSTELAQIGKTATPGPSPTVTATARVTRSPTPPAATPEAAPTACPQCPEPVTCPSCPEPVTCPTCPEAVTCPTCPTCPQPVVCPTCPEPVICADCPVCPSTEPAGLTPQEQFESCQNARADGMAMESSISLCEQMGHPCTYEREQLAVIEDYLNAHCR